MKLAVICVPMTSFMIDVIYGASKEEAKIFCIKRYGVDEMPNSVNECALYYSGCESELKGEKRFYIALEYHPKKAKGILIHELWHLMWNISYEIRDFRFTQKSNKHGAYMIEQIYNDIINAKYEEYIIK